MKDENNESIFQEYLKSEELCPLNFKKLKKIEITHYMMPESYFNELYKCTFLSKKQLHKELELFL